MAEQEPTVDQHLQEAAEMNPSRPPQPEPFIAESPADAALHDAEVIQADDEVQRASSVGRGMVDQEPVPKPQKTFARKAGEVAATTAAAAAAIGGGAWGAGQVADMFIADQEQRQEQNREWAEEAEEAKFQQDMENGKVTINLPAETPEEDN